jgi:hypothetical protein
MAGPRSAVGEWSPRKVSASIVLDGKAHPVWIEASEDLFQGADFLLPVALLPAMKVGAPLRPPGKVSPRLLSSMREVQDIFSMWESLFERVPVEAETREGIAERASGAACFFSGGMDSFHTLLRNQDEISHLIYLHRRPPNEDHSAMEASARRVRRIAEELGKSMIEVDTNLYSFAHEAHINWKYYHGAWIASAALLFQHMFHKVFIAASSTHEHLRPQGTHPVLDHLWSTEYMDFRHDGCEVRRVDKAAYIADFPVAMRWLQVCDATRGAYNCGKCNKCFRSMLNLKAHGVLERCETLPDEIDLEVVANLDLSSYTEHFLAQDSLKVLERRGTEPELTRTLKENLETSSHAIAHSGYADEQMDNALTRLRASSKDLHNLKIENRKLEARVADLTRERTRLLSHYSSRRYKLVDKAVETFLRIPGTRRAVRGMKGMIRHAE